METESSKFSVDIGIGSGLWCMEVANEYPDCSVVSLGPVRAKVVPSENVVKSGKKMMYC